ncbi:MAG: hypothetical protein HC925_05715 [Coleofasciculaceae cyanobacterium SM2_3_26]|nr:hypothetical protein [Coleofasciculaceae cyanobacterium SM2_3_26]
MAIYVMLAVVLAAGYRWLGRYAMPVLRLGQAELTAIARLHWLAGMGFMFFAFWLESFGQLSGLGIGAMALLGIYATLEGRSREEWTYAGITGLTVAIAQALNAFVPTSVLVWWGAPAACGIGSLLYFRDWERWGWSSRPWRGYATVLPIGILLFITLWRFASPPVVSLLIVAGFYAGLALSSRRIRLSYLSLFLANWAIAKIFNDSGIQEPLWQLAVLCLSGLYLIQVEPSLRSPDSRDTRHWLRCLAVGLFCFRISWSFGGEFVPGLLVAGVGIGLAIAGLGLRVRSLLYVGTLTFAIQIARQLIVFASQYSLALWGLLTVVGAFFIWVAATFEARRSQMTRSLGERLAELQEWE